MVGFVKENGFSFAGKHLLIDLYDCKITPEHTLIESAMVDACIATGATVLFQHSHPFPGGGSSGVVILAESHGTWHSWPEEKFTAVDIFVCGECQPEEAVSILERLFQPKRTLTKLEKRGILENKKETVDLSVTTTKKSLTDVALQCSIALHY
jgi:S-adenosylmethionine decarboxylase